MPPGPVTTRTWLVHANRRLAPLLPPVKYGLPPMLTDDLNDSGGRPVDLVKHFRINPSGLESIWINFLGLAYSAQASSTADESATAPPWPGFGQVWIPVREGLELSGRLGLARTADGRVADADCIVVLPGLHGTDLVLRQRDLAQGLRACGLHVLTVALRGQGETDRRYPDVRHTWGVLETDDLLVVANWLQHRPHVRRTGLVGFSWSANLALMVAWRDGRPRDARCTSPRLAEYFGPVVPGPHYQAGVVAFSPILRFEELIDELDTPWSGFYHPVRAGLQNTVRRRMRRKYQPDDSGSLRKLLEYERPDYPGSLQDGLRFLRMMPYKGQPCENKLADIRIPVLIVHAANDPITPVQAVADLMAQTSNPNVAAIVTPSGGHIGFAPCAPAWYYSLLINYFDPASGPAAHRPAGGSAIPPEAMRQGRQGGLGIRNSEFGLKRTADAL